MEPIKLGFLTIYPFGLLMILPALGALLLAARSMGKAGLKKETAGWFALLAVPLCFALARLGFCLFVIDQMLGAVEVRFRIFVPAAQRGGIQHIRPDGLHQLCVLSVASPAEGVQHLPMRDWLVRPGVGSEEVEKESVRMGRLRPMYPAYAHRIILHEPLPLFNEPAPQLKKDVKASGFTQIGAGSNDTKQENEADRIRKAFGLKPKN